MTRLGVDRALVAGEWAEGDVEIDDGVVVSVGVPRRSSSGLAATPGFVDLQVNGAAGIDLRREGADGVLRVARALLATGVTAFQPTCYSTDLDGYLAFLHAVREARHVQREGGADGARILPAHLEGPFLSPRWAGAHDPEMLMDPDLEVLDALLAVGPVGMLTLAPELPGGMDAVRRASTAGVVVSVGHSDATAAQTAAAVDAGARALTHCWNAHRRMTARDPGPAGCALTDQRVTVGLIADHHHVAPEMLRLAFASAVGRIALVTDLIAPALTDATRWEVDGASVTVEGGRATVADGTLAGAVATMDDVVRRLVESGLDEVPALAAASTTPAALLGVHAGLTPGARADVVVLDAELVVRRTLVGGVESVDGPG